MNYVIPLLCIYALGFKVIPLKKRLPHGTKELTTPLNLSFN